MPVTTEATLTDFADALLRAGGAPAEEARIVAVSLVQSNLRGHDSHGVMRIPFYLDRVSAGVLQPAATLTVERETDQSLVCDGGWGFGQVLSQDLMRRLIRKSDSAAVVCGTLRRSAHIGRLGEYAEMAADAGRIALLCVNNHGAGQRVAPIGGIRPRLGTNPLCIGIPNAPDAPFIFDIGTSATAEGKVRVKRIAGQQVPLGWILDPDGNPTTDPNQLYGDPPGTILPLGGKEQGYKGFGLAFMIELLCGGLSGGICSHPEPPPPLGNCGTFIVFNPEQFAGSDHLHCMASSLETYVRDVPRAAGVAEITLPGDPERRTLATRRESGIPLDDGNWKALVDLAVQLGVTPPQL